MPPAGAQSPGDRAAWCPHRLATSPLAGIAATSSCSWGSCPRLRGTARSIPAGSAAQSHSEPEAPLASSVAHTTGRPGAAIRTLGSLSPPPRVPLGVLLRFLPGISAAAGGSRRSAWQRRRARHLLAPGSARACRQVRGHLPARARRGGRGPPGRRDRAGEKSGANFVNERRLEFTRSGRPRGAGITHGGKGGGSGGLGLRRLLRGRSRAPVAASFVGGRKKISPRFLPLLHLSERSKL